jgi:3-oxoacyl-[acyl-carrier-protein] synthase-3
VIRGRIIGTGSYLPEGVITNRDLEKIVDTSDEWIIERTGIRERRIATAKQAASDLAFEAAAAALKRAHMKAKDLDLIIVATITADMPFPSTACVLQGRLGAKNAAAFDVNAACSGFIYGLHIASGFIKSGLHKKILLVGTETLSKVTDWQDRSTCILFGDGAGAVIIEPTKEKRGIFSTHIHSDGDLGDFIALPGGGSRNPCSQESIRKKLHFIKMRGNETFKVAVRTLEEPAFPSHSSPGEYKDHSGHCETARHAGGEGLRKHRTVRQHLCGVDPDRARRSRAVRQGEGRRFPPPRSLRRRPHLGVFAYQMVG